MSDRRRLCAALELALVFGLWLVTVWGVWPATGASVWTGLGFLGLGGIVVLSITVRRPDWRNAGFRLDNLIPAVLHVALPVGVFGALFFAVLYLTATPFTAAPAAKTVHTLIGGIFQQAFFLGYLLPRWILILTHPVGAVAVNALAFALVHLPHLFLTGLTFLGGLFLGALFLRAPNILVLGMTHGALSALVVPTLLSLQLLETTRIGPPELAPIAAIIASEWRPGDRVGIGPRAVRLDQFGRRLPTAVEWLGDGNADDAFNRKRVSSFFLAQERVFCVLTGRDFALYIDPKLRAQFSVLAERLVVRRKFVLDRTLWNDLLYGNGDMPVLGALRERVLLVSNKPRRASELAVPDKVGFWRTHRRAPGTKIELDQGGL